MAHNSDRELPIGPDLGGWQSPTAMVATELRGRYATLIPLSPTHASALHAEFATADDSLWTYMTMGPFSRTAELQESLDGLAALKGWSLFTVMLEGSPRGFLAYLRDQPDVGVIEIGSIVFGPSIQRTRVATEAVFLLLDHAFDCGYRRVEWKCDDLNQPSIRAADRFGFTYEGTFRQATHYKGRNRDTAWYSIIDSEWPQIDAAFTAWLAPTNFDETGRQIRRLEPPKRST